MTPQSLKSMSNYVQSPSLSAATQSCFPMTHPHELSPVFSGLLKVWACHVPSQTICAHMVWLCQHSCFPGHPLLCHFLHKAFHLFHQDWVALSSFVKLITCMLHAKSLQPCPTLCDPMDLWPSRLLCPWDSPSRVLEWVAVPSFGGSSWPRNWTHISYIFCTGQWAL